MAESERRVWVWIKMTEQGLSRDTRATLAHAHTCGVKASGVLYLETGVLSPAQKSTVDRQRLCAELASLGADTLLFLHAHEEAFLQLEAPAQALVWAVEHALEAEMPIPTDIVATADLSGRDCMARLASALRAPLLQDCVDIHFGTGKGEKYILSGRTRGIYTMPEGLRCWTLRHNAYPAPAAGEGVAGAVTVYELVAPKCSGTVRVLQGVEAESGEDDALARFWAEQPDLGEASIILAGGRPLGSREQFALLHGLANTLHASVGASRSAVDMGYAPPSVQIGQTGIVVSPELYMAFGISGSIYHLAGIRTARKVVAVDTDPHSDMFARADYGLHGDLFEVLPLLQKLLSSLPETQSNTHGT